MDNEAKSREGTNAYGGELEQRGVSTRRGPERRQTFEGRKGLGGDCLPKNSHQTKNSRTSLREKRGSAKSRKYYSPLRINKQCNARLWGIYREEKVFHHCSKKKRKKELNWSKDGKKEYVKPRIHAGQECFA